METWTLTFTFIVVVAAAAAFAVGCAVVWAVFHGRLSKASDEISSLTGRVSSLTAEVSSLAAQNEMLRTAREEDERHHRDSIDAQERRFAETLDKVTAQLKTATEDMLKQRQKEFSDSSAENIGQIVNPLKETIDRMKQAVNDSTLKQTAMSGEMKANIENMMKFSEAARKSADALANAFRHGNKVQGDWGEAVLDELLSSQGLERGVHYDVQTALRDAEGQTLKSATGGTLRPDVILHLDRGRDVIIDSKVSLSAFMDYVNAGNEDDRKRFLDAHVASLKAHVKELSAKDYSSYVRPPKQKMDYVIMFVPNTGALWTALNAQPDLWRKSMEKNVFIADEQTLFAALKIISMTWRQIAQVQNQEKVFALAGELMDRVGQFMKKYREIGDALDKARRSYDDGERKLQPSGQSILQTCAKLERLGVSQSAKNPLPQLSEAELPETAAVSAAAPDGRPNDSAASDGL